MNQLAETSQTGSAMTVDQGRNPFESYGDLASGRTGTIFKFKDGEFLLGVDEQEIPLGTEMLIDMAGMEIGWLKWWDGVPVDRHFGRLAEGFSPGSRADRGDTNKDEWELDPQGNPRDPWQFGNEVPVYVDGVDEEEVTLVAASRGMINAIGTVSKAYGGHMRMHPDELPVVKLGSDSYVNKTWNRKVKIPVFEIVGWSTVADWLGEPEPKPAPKKRGRPKKAAVQAEDVASDDAEDFDDEM